jgi:YgiT-type zinc finger domain-containing protein
MKCVICNRAETMPGLTSVLLERDELALTFKNVPAQICPNCGEAYADETVTAGILYQAERMAKAGIKMDVREYTLIGD